MRTLTRKRRPSALLVLVALEEQPEDKEEQAEKEEAPRS